MNIGDKAPDFKGVTQKEQEIQLSDFSGKKLILYFYPKDNTPGCKAEACSLRDGYSQLLKDGFVVVGVSADSIKLHNKFIESNSLPFDLISDPDKIIINAYGAWGEKKMCGRTYDGIIRKTFVIDENGVVEKIFDKVKTKDHFNQILESYK